MAFVRIKKDQAVPVRNIIAVIFGEPGIGKTSLSFRVQGRPVIHLDFDKGLGRALMKGESVQIDSWSDMVTEMNNGYFEEFRNGVAIIDTAKAMLDEYMAQEIIKSDKRLANATGGLSLQGFGALKSSFEAFYSRVNSYNMDLIFICHEKSITKKGEETRFIPAMTGGSSDILMGKADLIGYMSSKGDRRSINFNPTDYTIGKNCAGIPELTVPDASSPEFLNFMGEIIDKVKSKFAEQSEEMKFSENYQAERRAMIKELKDLSEVEQMASQILDKPESVSAVYQYAIWDDFIKRFIELIEFELSLNTSTDDANNLIKVIKGLGAYGLTDQALIPLKKAFIHSAKEVGLIIPKDSPTGEFVEIEDRPKPKVVEPAQEQPVTDEDSDPANQTETKENESTDLEPKPEPESEPGEQNSSEAESTETAPKEENGEPKVSTSAESEEVPTNLVKEAVTKTQGSLFPDQAKNPGGTLKKHQGRGNEKGAI